MKNIFLPLLIFIFSACNSGQIDNSSENSSVDSLSVEQSENTVSEPELILPEIKVQLFARTGIFYDEEGYPMEAGKFSEIKNFQESREFKKKKEYDQIDKIVIEGKSDDISIEVYDNVENKVIYEKENFSLQGQLIFTYPAPLSEQDKNYAEWLNWRWHPNITLFIKFKSEIVFEGEIIQ